jgi:hypothetical protein
MFFDQTGKDQNIVEINWDNSLCDEILKYFVHHGLKGSWCKGNLTDLRRILHLSLAKGNPK